MLPNAMPITPPLPEHPVARICALLHVPPARRPFLIRNWKPILQLAASLLLFAWTMPSTISHLNKHASTIGISLFSLFLLRIVYEVFRHKPRSTNTKDTSS
jgi:hypothetical protein